MRSATLVVTMSALLTVFSRCFAHAEPPPTFQVDAAEAPDLKEWGERSRAICEHWYPRIAQALHAPEPSRPRDIHITFHARMDAPAATGGDTIFVNASYVRDHPDDLGMMIHELTHVIQAYPGQRQDLGWLTEGIADYIRFWLYEPEVRQSAIDPARDSYRSGYRISAAFLGWLVSTRDTDGVIKLNTALHAGDQDVTLFNRVFGQNVDELWNAFVQAGAPSSPNALRDSLWNSRGCNEDARGTWFRDAKFGAFIHFGPYSTLGGYYKGQGPYRPAEQIIGLGERHAAIPPEEYRSEVASKFNPARFDAREWVRLMKLAGQKYVILTTKHHDGFCMFKTGTTTFNVVESSPFGRDLVKEVSQACREEGLEFCPYFSIGDWCADAVMKPGFPTYRDYMFAQLRELLSNYGNLKMLWFDNWWYVNDQWSNDAAHAKDLYSFTRSVSPGLLVNDRCGRGAKSNDGDYTTPENQLQGSLQSRYFEVVMTNTDDDNWGWVRGASNYRKPADLIRNLIDCVSKGGNFVLNVGPDADGSFPAEHVAILTEIGSWTRINGEGIYETRPAPRVTISADTPAYATQSKDGRTIYVHVIAWPNNHAPLEITLSEPLQVSASLLDPALGTITCDASIEGRTTRVRIRPPPKLDPYATAVRLAVTPPADRSQPAPQAR